MKKKILVMMISSTVLIMCEVVGIVLLIAVGLAHYFDLFRFVTLFIEPDEIYQNDLIYFGGNYHSVDLDFKYLRFTIRYQDGTPEGSIVHEELILIEEVGKKRWTREWRALAPGFYKARIEFYKPTKGIGRNAAEEDFVVMAGENPNKYTLKLWCGQHTKGNPGERLSLPFAHPLAVQVEGATEPVAVKFQTDWGKFGISGEKTSTMMTQKIIIDGKEVWIAFEYLVLDDLPPGSPPNNLEHRITVTCEKAINQVYFSVYSIMDGEASHDIEEYTHQKGYQPGMGEIEVAGDNYVQIDNDPDPGDPADYKDVIVELDYWKGVTDDDPKLDIVWIAAAIETILRTAGITPQVIIDDKIEAMERYPDRQERMGLLYTYKDPLTGHERIWQNKIHLIIGRDGTLDPPDPDVMGIVEDYSGEEFWKTLHLGSEELNYSSPFLDSVGCFVFYDRIVAYQGLVIPEEQAIALVSAHEIGHALGMWHYDIPEVTDEHVMVANLYNAFANPNGFYIYGCFDRRTLDGSYDVGENGNPCAWDGMNTRHILGKDCVCIREI